MALRRRRLVAVAGCLSRMAMPTLNHLGMKVGGGHGMKLPRTNVDDYQHVPDVIVDVNAGQLPRPGYEGWWKAEAAQPENN